MLHCGINLHHHHQTTLTKMFNCSYPLLSVHVVIVPVICEQYAVEI